MKLVRHLFAADVRRFRSTIVAWVALVVIMRLLDVVQPRLALNSGLVEWFEFAAGLLWLAWTLLLAAIVAGVVQTHALVGTTAFWFARPIPSRVLLASKVLLLFVLLVAVPAVSEMVLMIAHRVPLSTVMLVALQSVLVGTLIVAGLMCAAAVTPNMTRFALVCIGAIVAVGLLGGLLAGTRVSSDPLARLAILNGGGPAGIAAAVDHTQPVLAALLFIAVAALLLVSQYTSRTVRRSVMAGLGGIVVATVILYLWPWRILVPRQSLPEWARSESALILSADSASVAVDRVWLAKPETVRLVRGNARLSGTAPAWMATARLHDALLEVPGIQSQTSTAYGYSAPLAEPSGGLGPLHAALRTVLGVERVATMGLVPYDRAVLFVGPHAQLEAVAGQPAAYRGNFTIDLTSLRLAAALPLQDGVTFQDGDFRFRVTGTRTMPDDDGLVVHARMSETSSVFDRRPPRTYLYFLRNLETGEARSVHANRVRGLNLRPALFGGGLDRFGRGFTVEAAWFRFIVPTSGGTSSQQEKEAWISKAQLVLVKAVAEGSAMRRLELSGVVLDPRVDEKPRRRQ